jgi:hypothetical protein
MNKRMKSKETKKEGVKTLTTSTSMYGTSYKKKSAISHQKESYESEYFFDNMEELLNKNKSEPLSFSAEQLKIYTADIFEWLKDNEILTEAPIERYHGKCKLDMLSQYLYNEVSTKGAMEASLCLNSISNLHRFIKREDYKKCLAFALELVKNYSLLQYSILEAAIGLGQSKQDGMIDNNTLLNNEQYEECFRRFDSLDMTTDGLRKLNKGEKWEMVIDFAKQKFEIIGISDRTLRNRYKAWKHA